MSWGPEVLRSWGPEVLRSWSPVVLISSFFLFPARKFRYQEMCYSNINGHDMTMTWLFFQAWKVVMIWMLWWRRWWMAWRWVEAVEKWCHSAATWVQWCLLDPKWCRPVPNHFLHRHPQWCLLPRVPPVLRRWLEACLAWWVVACKCHLCLTKWELELILKSWALQVKKGFALNALDLYLYCCKKGIMHTKWNAKKIFLWVLISWSFSKWMTNFNCKISFFVLVEVHAFFEHVIVDNNFFARTWFYFWDFNLIRLLVGFFLQRMCSSC